jgi:hypothetical protein
MLASIRVRNYTSISGGPCLFRAFLDSPTGNWNFILFTISHLRQMILLPVK